MVKKILFMIAVLATISACSSTRPDLKSPCVGADGSPCDRRAVNNAVL